MDELRWEELVRRLERQAHEHPRAYRRKVARVAALGYAYIALTLLLLGALAGGVVYLVLHHPGPLVKLLLPILVLAWIILRSLAVRVDPPGGLRITPDDAPDLFRVLGATNDGVQGPRVQEVLIDDALNAGVVQVARAAGLLGRRNYLVLGLPLLYALTPEEFEAVLAHELAHLSRDHGRLSVFLYRVRATWYQLLEALEERRSWATFLFRRFFEWYVPYFNAHALPLLRAHEFEADRIAARAVGGETIVRALARLAVADRFLATHFWPRLYERARDDPKPPAGALAELGRALASARSLRERAAWVDEELATEPDPGDTHPSLAQRAEALGVPMRDVLPIVDPGASAARLLGGRKPRVIDEVQAAWQREVASVWQAEHRQAQGRRQRLEVLEAQAERLDADDAAELGRLTEEFLGAEAAEARYRLALGRDGDSAQARFALGRILLDRGDESGLVELKRAMDADPDAVLPACELAVAFLRDRARDSEAAEYEQHRDEHLRLLTAAAEERESVSVDDVLEPHGLPEDLLERLRTQLGASGAVAEAYVVRKHLEHFADSHPLFVVAVVPKHRLRQAWREADDDAVPLADELAEALDLPGQVIVASVGAGSPLVEHMASVPESLVVGRS